MIALVGKIFDLNIQQDVPEILHVVLDELKGISALMDSILSSTIQTLHVIPVAWFSNLKTIVLLGVFVLHFVPSHYLVVNI